MIHWIAAALVFGSMADDSWTEFRGPGGKGHSDAKGLPREWSETKNVVWKTPLHGRGWSSPVVSGGQVWLTTGTFDGNELSVICVDRETGKVLLDQVLFKVEKPDPVWKKYNSYASPTPVIEDGRIYITFGTYGTTCLDMKTFKPVWVRDDLHCNHWRGAGSSPILFENLLILTFDGYDVQYIVALDKKTGKTAWKTDRTHKMPDDGDQKKGYCTPIIIQVDGKPQLISSASSAVTALDPRTGQLIWWVTHKGHSPAARSLYGHGLVYVTNGAGKELIAIKPDGKGDVTSTHVAWKINKGTGHKPSYVLVDDLLYLLTDGPALATCVDAKTGAQVWQSRVPTSSFSAGPLVADGVMYLFGEDGAAVVIQPGREYKELAKNQLGEVKDREAKSTPAIAGKAFFIRTDTHLYRIEQK